ncbi:probable carbohydrate esterase At4g34215 [Cajanus cajan]|uniref:Carbohydrate esterase At4g34215 family n=1 Tax=Cajanus cajan TaxID=3821 RepID=A0A151RPH3_CAJCA|nr:probable carbohydrate esterase At4g34215 [Cajanus cajan]KYP44413.1 putative carbohydrate esterase At4g34215 family [Cajanus cajan]
MAVISVVSWFLFIFLSAQSGLCSVPRDIFVLAGQSNMAGRGGVVGGKWDGNVPPECRPGPRILRLSAGLKWEEAREPLHADIDVAKTCGVGPGMAFAKEVAKGGGGPGWVGLVPCAVGGTKIGEWSRGSRLYNELVQRAVSAIGDGGALRALVWYQGESDTVREEDAEAYKGRMERLIMDLRSDLHLPSLLVIQVALASGEGKFIEKVRLAQMGITLPNVKCVDAKGLSLNPDKLHLTTMSQVHLGIRLARAYLASTNHHYQFNCNMKNHTQVLAS